jgi:hypothetical protein
MLSDDYLVRRIMQFAMVMARIFGLKKAGDYPEALQEIDQSLEQLLGMNIELIKIMDEESVHRILTQNGQMDLEKLRLIAELYYAEGEIFFLQNNRLQSEDSYLRSLNQYLYLRLNAETPRPDEVSERIDALVRKLGDCDYPDKTRFDLFCYYENNEQYAEAEQMITRLAARPEPDPNAKSELSSFYARLLELDPEVLQANGMSRVQIQNKINDLN